MKAAYITEAGLDGVAWLDEYDRVKSLATVAVAEGVMSLRAEAQK